MVFQTDPPKREYRCFLQTWVGGSDAARARCRGTWTARVSDYLRTSEAGEMSGSAGA